MQLIDVSKSNVTLAASKVEIKLKKAEPASWRTLSIERQQEKEKEENEEEEKKSLEQRVDAVDLSDIWVTQWKESLSLRMWICAIQTLFYVLHHQQLSCQFKKLLLFHLRVSWKTDDGFRICKNINHRTGEGYVSVMWKGFL